MFKVEGIISCKCYTLNNLLGANRFSGFQLEFSDKWHRNTLGTGISRANQSLFCKHKTVKET